MDDPQQPRLTSLDEWEMEAANVLDGGDYGAELGLRMARDVIRAPNGELPDEAFHEEYHETVVAEFGEGARPIEPGGFNER